MNKEYEVAQTSSRIGAFIIDFMTVFLLWYFFTKKDLEKVNVMMQTLDPVLEGSIDIFAGEVIRLYVIFILKFVFIKTLYYTLVPAVIGRGKTVGKLVFGLSMLDAETLKEIAPAKLILREFVLRCMFETLLIIPSIVSVFLIYLTKKATAIHDLWARTVVVRDSSFICDGE
jgi:uncharacterized RDD family membrane protein YckC